MSDGQTADADTHAEPDVGNASLSAGHRTVSAGHRTHPASLLLRLLAGLPNLIFPIAAIIFGARGMDAAAGLIIWGVAGFMAISMFFGWLAWSRFRYIIDADDIRIESGIVSRSARSIPYERIQDVSIEQTLLPRIFGLGEVKFETGSGEGEDARLAYVTMDEGTRLRSLIRDRRERSQNNSAGTAIIEETKTAINDDEKPVFAMSLGRVLTFGLFEFSLVIFAVLLGLAQQFEFLLPIDIFDAAGWTGLAQDSGVDFDSIDTGARIIGAIAALASLIILGIATGVLRTLFREYGFILKRSAKGFRRQRGLATRTDVVMPLHRVQAASVHSGFIRRLFGWHALKFVSLAQDSKKEASHVAAPFAKWHEIESVIRETGITLPGIDTAFQRPSPRWWLDQFLLLLPLIAVVMTTIWLLTDGSIYTWTPALMLLPIALLMALDWRTEGYCSDEGQLTYRQGWWQPLMIIAPHIKIQSVDIRQGPIARLRGLAVLEFGIAGGSLKLHGVPLDAACDMRRQTIAVICTIDFSEVNRV